MQKKVTDAKTIGAVKKYCDKALGSKAVGQILETEKYYRVELMFEKPNAHTKIVGIYKSDVKAEYYDGEE